MRQTFKKYNNKTDNTMNTNMKRMKTTVFMMVMAALMLLPVETKAQYKENQYGIQPWFGTSLMGRKDSGNGYTKGEYDSYLLGLPSDHGLTDDFGAPLGSGIVVLMGLGAAYLVGKRRKEE